MPPVNMTPQQYCLRWKFHHNNLQTMFTQLLDRGCFCDVTIACEGQTLRAHRVVLCACSTYFDSILTNCSINKEPIIMMRDCRFADIKSLVDFMYKGEINVEHNNLASILKTAVDLRIKGLADVPCESGPIEEGGDTVINRSRKQFAAAMAAVSGPSDTDGSMPNVSSSESSIQITNPIISNVIVDGPLSHMDNHLVPSAAGVPSNLLHSRLSVGPDHQQQQHPIIMGMHPMHSGHQSPSSMPNSNYQHHQQQQLEQNYHIKNHPMTQIQQQPIKRKRGRPPLDGEFDCYSTPKITHVEGGADPESFVGHHHARRDSSSDPLATCMVEVMLDDQSQSATEPHPSSNDGQQLTDKMSNVADNEQTILEQSADDSLNLGGHDHDGQSQNEDHWNEFGLEMQIDCEEDTLAGRLIPKLERPDTPKSQEGRQTPKLELPNDAPNVIDERRRSTRTDVSPMDVPIASPTLITPATAEFFTTEELAEWSDVIKMNDYLTTGRRQEFWDERFTMRVMDSIRKKELEMKKGACLLGVSYGTLYGRYRETYGCLKQIIR